MKILRFSLPTVKLYDGDPLDEDERDGRFLLARGNGKLGDDVLHWSIPAEFTCPGKSRNCSGTVVTGPSSVGSQRCYAIRMYDYRPALLRGHQRNLAMLSDLPRWTRRVIEEIRFRRATTVRIHVAGDFHKIEYVRAWMLIATACPDCDFFTYSRSWRVKRLRPVLERLSTLPNVAVWWSCDATTGIPSNPPTTVRLCWLGIHRSEAEPHAFEREIKQCDLVFLDQPIRGDDTFAGVRVCPQEHRDVTCSSCRSCIPRKEVRRAD